MRYPLVKALGDGHGAGTLLGMIVSMVLSLLRYATQEANAAIASDAWNENAV